MGEVVRVALAGNPNAGKTSLFNGLTGARQKVANYPGVTVERREGQYRWQGLRYDVLDLPGTYSLTSYSPEERVAQRELVDGTPDVAVVVVDSTNLKRHLILLSQVMQLGANPVLALNMWDEAERAELELDVGQMEALLGFPVVTTTASSGKGVKKLKDAIARAAASPQRATGRLVLGDRLQLAIDTVRESLAGTEFDDRSANWTAQKLLMADGHYEERLRAVGESGQAAVAVAAEQREALESSVRIDAALYVAEQYYGFVDGLLREVVTHPSRSDARLTTERIDAILAHRLLGLPLFLLIMYALFWFTFTVGEYPMGWMETGFEALGGWMNGLWPEGSDSPLRSLLVDGVIGGVGGVLVFLPNILLLFLGLAFLEDSGYLARSAFLVDRVLHRFGLHGQSFIPLVTGFGCSIPGIMATRALANERDRLATMMVLPLMSCGARLPIWMLLIPAFFPATWRAPMLWVIYLIGIMLALVLALVLRRTVLKGEDAPFVMELPPYRLPTGRAVVRAVVDRSWLYLRKAGTLILGISIVMWALASYPEPSIYSVDEYVSEGRVVVIDPPAGADAETIERLRAEAGVGASDVRVMLESEVEGLRAQERMESSIAGHIGRAMEPVLAPMGFDWRIGTALLGAFVAKEVFVSQMGVVYALGEADSSTDGLRSALARDYSPLVGFTLMLFLLIATPCMATFAVVRRESGSWGWPALQFFGLTLVAFLICTIVYQVGSLF